MADASTDPKQERAARIVAVFSVLIHAWQHNDFTQAAKARDELAALGVKVTIPRRQSRKGGDDANCHPSSCTG